MAIKNLIVRGFGFDPGSTKFIVTRGYETGAVALDNAQGYFPSRYFASRYFASRYFPALFLPPAAATDQGGGNSAKRKRRRRRRGKVLPRWSDVHRPGLPIVEVPIPVPEPVPVPLISEEELFGTVDPDLIEQLMDMTGPRQRSRAQFDRERRQAAQEQEEIELLLLWG